MKARTRTTHGPQITPLNATYKYRDFHAFQSPDKVPPAELHIDSNFMQWLARERGLTARDLHTRIHDEFGALVAYNTIASLLSGNKTRLQFGTLSRIAWGLQIDPRDLLIYGHPDKATDEQDD